MPSFLSLERGEMRPGFLLDMPLESANLQYPVDLHIGSNEEVRWNPALMG